MTGSPMPRSWFLQRSFFPCPFFFRREEEPPCPFNHFLLQSSVYLPFASLLNYSLLSSRYSSVSYLFFWSTYISPFISWIKWPIHRKRIGLTFYFSSFLSQLTWRSSLSITVQRNRIQKIGAYLKAHLKEGDKISMQIECWLGSFTIFGSDEGRYYVLDDWKVSENEVEYRKCLPTK